MIDSKVEEVSFKGKQIFIKRDDLLHSSFDGNKARKLHYLFSKDLSSYQAIVSFGSNQSNSMYSLSSLCKLKNIRFIYITHKLSSYLENNIQGNLKYALDNGMELIQSNDKEEITKYKNNVKYLVIDEGIATKEASQGLKILANEIEEFSISSKLSNLNIFSPSGTGTTSLYLQKYSKFNVFTTPCVGNKEYLFKQMQLLEEDSSIYPTILTLEKKYHFGKLYKEFYALWLELKNDTKIKFDLLYDPLGWMVVLKHLYSDEKNLLYIHSGGIRGNISMIKRYENFLK
ncbi:MAG: pyridoxal phosphate-dependent deaminase, putative [uncultured Campylobacterales bacterium]|uniref:Pyridoxal phosphate-dependent deaminase, putative n=1 Tax=uncultured Campylobacterales bacterium TaxID=352960 RepID=A0A6S6S554_9BACT|nr:MAG: pyridoxal phosphate-dependent deaminase, putative [uncultured Campylobacterales bacterium]